MLASDDADALDLITAISNSSTLQSQDHNPVYEVVRSLIFHQFGNYVLQRMLEKLEKLIKNNTNQVNKEQLKWKWQLLLVQLLRAISPIWIESIHYTMKMDEYTYGLSTTLLYLTVNGRMHHNNHSHKGSSQGESQGCSYSCDGVVIT